MKVSKVHEPWDTHKKWIIQSTTDKKFMHEQNALCILLSYLHSI